ncbi:MAG: hypothetical protein KGJ07_03155 [Patescibacteria group bacterium]|nr:hypothetical protein [Patescibacteria group bacterium]MDE2588152.1 hypothetical protein [Patescibacteria group bacterium]
MNYIANVTAVTLDLLDASNYSGDKSMFANQLVGLSLDQALLDLLSHIPDRDKELLEVKLAGNSEFDEIYTLLAGYFGQETMKKMLAKHLHGNISAYLQSQGSGMSANQKSTLDQLLEESNLTNSISAVENLLEIL